MSTNDMLKNNINMHKHNEKFLEVRYEVLEEQFSKLFNSV